MGGGLYLFWSILETLTQLAALSDEARPAGTLSAHVVAVCAVLTAAHLGALGAVETRRTTCRERPVNFHNTLPRHQLFTRRRSSKQQHVWRKRGFCATGFNLLHGSSPPVQSKSKSSPVQSASKHNQQLKIENHNRFEQQTPSHAKSMGESGFYAYVSPVVNLRADSQELQDRKMNSLQPCCHVGLWASLFLRGKKKGVSLHIY